MEEQEQEQEQEQYDFVIVGSGAGSVPAALKIRSAGYKPLIVEKQAVIGGTSAYSGGVIWIPNNRVGDPDGSQDSADKSRTYMEAVAGDSAAEVSASRRDAFIKGGPEMVEFLQNLGMQFVDAEWPDYHDELAGGRAAGRSLCAPLFNARKLGAWREKLASFALTTDIPMASPEARHVFVAKKTWRGKFIVLLLAWRIFLKLVFRRDVRGAGPALQGRLFEIALRENIPIWTESPVEDLLVEDGVVKGVVLNQKGRRKTVIARLGVLINACGFSRNLSMREKYQPKPTSVDWTIVNPADTGDLHLVAQKYGAALDFMDESWWLPSSFHPDGGFAGFHSPNDISKPHCIVVNGAGQRFVNESSGYMEFGQNMYANAAVPAWAVFDSQHRNSYTWGAIMPGRPPKKLLESGYMLCADSLIELAEQCGIDATALVQTVDRFNHFAQKGIDEDFGRGQSAYNHYYGDPTHQPNPNLGVLEKAPFYAVKLYPADVGTAGGLVADEHARVLKEDGTVIPGLYVTGNSASPVVGRCYPGAGSSVGPSMVFGYLAASHAAGEFRDEE